MKVLIFFYGKNISKCCLLKILPRVLSVKMLFTPFHYHTYVANIYVPYIKDTIKMPGNKSISG